MSRKIAGEAPAGMNPAQDRSGDIACRGRLIILKINY